MLKDYQDRKYNDYMYSQAADLVLEWGKLHLLSPERSEQMDKITEEWEYLREHPEWCPGGKFAIDLSDVDLIKQDAESALNLLKDVPCFWEDSEESWDVQFACEIFDNILFFYEACTYFPHKGDLPEEFYGTITELYEEITGDLPVWRLIPINKWRREICKNIPEELQYLFPWYSEYKDIPSDAIDNLIDFWDEIESGNMDELAKNGYEYLYEILPEILAEILADSALKNYIRKHAVLNDLIPKAIGESLALRLFFMSDKEAEFHPVASIVKEKGLVACACKILENKKNKLYSENDRLETIFLSAFCGPLLNNGQRLDLFEIVERNVKKADISAFAKNTLMYGILSWAKGELPDDVFAKKVFYEWATMLSEAALEITEPVPDDASVFFEKIREIMDAPLIKEKAEEPASFPKIPDLAEIQAYISEIIQDCFSPLKAEPSLSYALSGDEDEDKNKTEPYCSERNIFYLPIIYNRRNKLLLAGKYEKDREFTRFRQEFLEKTKVFWNGFYKLTGRNKESIKSEPESATRLPLGRLEQKDYESVVIFISTKKEIVEKAMSEEKLSDGEKQELIILIYAKEK